jgi:hypothetical protein
MSGSEDDLSTSFPPTSQSHIHVGLLPLTDCVAKDFDGPGWRGDGSCMAKDSNSSGRVGVNSDSVGAIRHECPLKSGGCIAKDSNCSVWVGVISYKCPGGINSDSVGVVRHECPLKSGGIWGTYLGKGCAGIVCHKSIGIECISG